MDHTPTDRMATFASLSTVFRRAVQNHYAQDEAFQAKVTHAMDLELLHPSATSSPQDSTPNHKDDGSRESYAATLAFNERVLTAYAKVAGDEALRAQLPAEQVSTDTEAFYMKMGCPTLARLHAPRQAPKPAAAS